MEEDNKVEKTEEDIRIPKAKFDKLNEKYRALLDEHDTLKDKYEMIEADGKKAATLKGQYDAVVKEFDTYKKTMSENMELSKLGIADPDAQEIVRFEYSRLKDENKPAFHEWAAQVKSDPEKMPRSLRGYLQTEQSKDPKNSDRKSPPNTNRVVNKENSSETVYRKGMSAAEFEELKRLENERLK